MSLMPGMSQTLLAFALLAAQSASAQSLLIYAGRLIDVDKGRVQTEVSLRIKDDRIIAIRAGYAVPGTDEQLIDLRTLTVLPGLIDSHVHVTQQSSAANRWEWYQLDPADYAIRSVVYARKTLEAGFTTVRDVGSQGGIAISLRNAINEGRIAGPRIFAAGTAIGSLGGHMDPTEGLNADLRRDPGAVDGVINSADEARKAVRARYKEGADLIKLAATGGVLDSGVQGDNTQLTAEELQAVVATARDYGMTVAVHAHGREGMLRAVQAGVDSIEHGTYMDDEVIREMKKRGTYLVPTLLAGDFVSGKAKQPEYFSDVVRNKAATIGPLMQNMFAKAYKAGVKIAFGTDTGVSAHGDNAQEFALMVAAGMPAMQAIQSATINAAQLLKKDSELGSLAPGKYADLIAVSSDPLADINALEKVNFVMKAGKVEKNLPSQ